MTASRPRRTFGCHPTGRRTGEDLLLLPLWFLLQVPATAGALTGGPAGILAWAERRAEEPMPARAADSLRREVTARPAAAGARLALATLARLGGEVAEARAHLAWLAAQADPAWSSAGWSGEGLIERERGSLDSARVRFQLAAERAREAGDPGLATRAAVGLASARFRRDGAQVALRILDAAPRAAADAAARAHWHCERLLYLPYANRSTDGPAESAAGRAAARRAGLTRLEAVCQLAASWFAFGKGEPAAWGALLDSADATFRRLGELGWRAFLLDLRGYYRVMAYDHQLAFTDLTAGAELAESLGSRFYRGWARRHLAHLAWHLGDLTLAERGLAEAEADLAAVGDEFGLASVRMVRVGLLTDLGHHDAARAQYAAIQGFADRAEMAVYSAWARLGLAHLELRRGEAAAARRELAALQGEFRAGGLDAVAASLDYDRGRAALADGALAEAELYLRRHLAGEGTRNPLDRFSARSRIAEVLARRGELARAAGELEAATDELEALRGSRREPQLRLLAFQTRKGNDDPDLGFARTFHRLAAGGELERAWLLAERRRARELTDHIVLAGGTAATGRAAASLPEVRRALAARRAAMLAYVTGDGNQPTSAILVSGAGASVTELPPVSAGASRLADLAEAAEGGEEGGLDSLALDAARRLLPPALGALPAEVRTLVIVEDQGLHRVPFDLLRLPSGEAVVERFAVQHAPSATFLLALWARPARRGADDILAFGDPLPPTGAEAGLTAAALYRGGETFGRLPGSAREARLVGGYARHSEVRVGRAATEAWLKRHPLERFRVIHVASHAVVGEEWASRTAIALTPGEGEDGFLTPAELAALPIAADLVVLSACRTARGMTVRGEGVLGLTAPLLAAGARAVIATGWDAPDEGMVRLSERLYDELAAGVPTGEAMRRAKLAARAAGRPAREWAAFRLTGDPFVVLPLRHPPPARWPLGAALLALVAAYGVTVSRRGRDRTARPSGNSARTIHA